MKRFLVAVSVCLILAANAAAQGVVYGDVAFAGSVYTTNLYAQPAGVYAALRQGGAWTNDGAYVWYRLAATNRQGRSDWVYSTNAVVLNVATGKQSSTVAWSNALGGVSGFLLQRRETTNAVANPAAASDAQLWPRWQAISVRSGSVVDAGPVRWSTNAAPELALWPTERSYPWTAGGTAGAAGTAERLVGTNSWIETAHGTTTQYAVSIDTNRMRIVSASADYNGPAVGTVFALREDSGGFFPGTLTYEAFLVGFVNLSFDATPTTAMLTDAAMEQVWTGDESAAGYIVYASEGEFGNFGSCVIDYGRVTNAAPLVTKTDVADGDISVRRIQMWDWGFGTNRWLVMTNDTIEIWGTRR